MPGKLFDGSILRGIGAGLAGLASHVNVQQLVQIGVVAAMSGGNPAAIAVSVGKAVLADLPAILPDPSHQAAVTDVVRAVAAVAGVVKQVRSAPEPA